jgi:hypothetical protein
MRQSASVNLKTTQLRIQADCYANTCQRNVAYMIITAQVCYAQKERAERKRRQGS